MHGCRVHAGEEDNARPRSNEQNRTALDCLSGLAEWANLALAQPDAGRYLLIYPIPIISPRSGAVDCRLPFYRWLFMVEVRQVIALQLFDWIHNRWVDAQDTGKQRIHVLISCENSPCFTACNAGCVYSTRTRGRYCRLFLYGLSDVSLILTLKRTLTINIKKQNTLVCRSAGHVHSVNV